MIKQHIEPDCDLSHRAFPNTGFMLKNQLRGDNPVVMIRAVSRITTTGDPTCVTQ